MQPTSKKTVYLIRHGITEANEYLHGFPWGSKGFKDPMFVDTQLSTKGIQLCHELRDSIKQGRCPQLSPEALKQIDVVVTSPLSRTMQTVNQIFFDECPLLCPSIPKIVQPLLSERLYLLSDTGRTKSVLQGHFPHFDFSLLETEDNWWYIHSSDEVYNEWRPEGQYACHGEPDEAFRARLYLARQWLLGLPYENILLVGHWGILRGLTGKDFRNLEVLALDETQILPHPFIDPSS